MPVAKVHELKCWPEPYRAIVAGTKTCEIRRDDRGGFAVGDYLRLREYGPVAGTYFGECCVEVTHVNKNFGLFPDYVALSIRRVFAAPNAIERVLVQGSTNPKDDGVYVIQRPGEVAPPAAALMALAKAESEFAEYRRTHPDPVDVAAGMRSNIISTITPPGVDDVAALKRELAEVKRNFDAYRRTFSASVESVQAARAEGRHEVMAAIAHTSRVVPTKDVHEYARAVADEFAAARAAAKCACGGVEAREQVQAVIERDARRDAYEACHQAVIQVASELGFENAEPLGFRSPAAALKARIRALVDKARDSTAASERAAGRAQGHREAQAAVERERRARWGSWATLMRAK